MNSYARSVKIISTLSKHAIDILPQLEHRYYLVSELQLNGLMLLRLWTLSLNSIKYPALVDNR